MEKKVSFKHISGAFMAYWNMWLSCRKCEKFNGNILGAFCIKDVIITSFVAEIGLKSLLVFENKISNEHDLNKLFESLSPEMQESLSEKSSYSLIDFKNKLNENSKHFVKWRYYYEFFETGEELSCNNEFMEFLLATLMVNICMLRYERGIDKVLNPMVDKLSNEKVVNWNC